jgi:hypothetical protein
MQDVTYIDKRSKSDNMVDDVGRLAKPTQGFNPMKHVFMQKLMYCAVVLDLLPTTHNMLNPVAASVCNILGQA